MTDEIKYATYRVPDHNSKTDAELAAAIIAPAALNKMTLLEFFQQVIAAGGIQAEVAPAYTHSEFMADLKLNLARGDLAALQVLVSLAENILTMTPVTTAAIQTVLTNNSLRLVDVVAAELGTTAPETITAQDVANARAA